MKVKRLSPSPSLRERWRDRDNSFCLQQARAYSLDAIQL